METEPCNLCYSSVLTCEAICLRKAFLGKDTLFDLRIKLQREAREVVALCYI